MRGHFWLKKQTVLLHLVLVRFTLYMLRPALGEVNTNKTYKTKLFFFFFFLDKKISYKSCLCLSVPLILQTPTSSRSALAQQTARNIVFFQLSSNRLIFKLNSRQDLLQETSFSLLWILTSPVNTILRQQFGQTCLPFHRHIMGFGDCPPWAYLHRLNSSYILNAKWFHPAARDVINMWMAFLTQIYSRIWLLAPGVLNNIEAEQRKKRGGKKGRQREKSLLTAAFSMLLCVVKMLPSELY